MAITKKSSLSHLDTLAAAAKSASEAVHSEAGVWGDDALHMRRSLHGRLTARGVPEDQAEKVTWHLAREMSAVAAQLVTASQGLAAVWDAVDEVLHVANNASPRTGVKATTSLPTGVS